MIADNSLIAHPLAQKWLGQFEQADFFHAKFILRSLVLVLISHVEF